jgi:hypothetical protein
MTLPPDDPRVEAHLRDLFREAIDGTPVPSELLGKFPKVDRTKVVTTGSIANRLSNRKKYLFIGASLVAATFLGAILVYSTFQPGVQQLVVVSRKSGGIMGHGPTAQVTTLEVTIPPATDGYITMLEWWDDGTLVPRPDRDQPWQRVKSGNSLSVMTPPLTFNADKVRSHVILLTENAAVSALHALPPCPITGVSLSPDPAFEKWLVAALNQQGVKVVSIGYDFIPPLK